jgi:hypothetical protein
MLPLLPGVTALGQQVIIQPIRLKAEAFWPSSVRLTEGQMSDRLVLC